MSKRKIINLAEVYTRFPVARLQESLRRFYFLYRESHMVDQNFSKNMHKLNALPYDTIDEMYANMRKVFGADIVGKNFLMKNWDYFNPNIRRKLCVTWEEHAPGRTLIRRKTI